MTGYQFLPKAEEEMNEAAQFYEGRSEGLGEDFLDEVQHTIESILAFPESGPVVSENFRRRILRRFPFGLLYAILRERGVRLTPIPWWLFLIFIAPMAIDGTTHLVNDALRAQFRQTNEWAALLTGQAFPATFYAGDHIGSLNSVLRFITGVLFGYGVVFFLWPMMNAEFSPEQ